MVDTDNTIDVQGARVHNLKNIDVEIKDLNTINNRLSSYAIERQKEAILLDYKEEKGKLYYITYFVSGSDSEIIVATTRPETML